MPVVAQALTVFADTFNIAAVSLTKRKLSVAAVIPHALLLVVSPVTFGTLPEPTCPYNETALSKYPGFIECGVVPESSGTVAATSVFFGGLNGGGDWACPVVVVVVSVERFADELE